jgi:hypothetical protein
MSRILNIILSGAVLLTVLGAHVQAQDKPPPFATTKVEGTDNVYVFRYGNSQAMFVVTPAGVIATDPIGYGRPQPYSICPSSSVTMSGRIRCSGR